MKQGHFSGKSLLKSILWSIGLTVVINLLFSCGSLRPSRINQRDDLSYKIDSAQTESTVKVTASKTAYLRARLTAQADALETISADAVGTENNKYLGFVGNKFKRYTIKYDVYLDGILIGSWEVAPRSSNTKELPTGNYQIVAYRQKGNEWVEPKTWDIEVTNLPKFDGYHFRLNGFE